MGRSRYHHYHRRRLARGPARPLLVLLCAALLAGAGVIIVMLVAMLAILGQFTLAGVGAVVVVRHLRRRRATSRQQPAHMTGEGSAPAVAQARVSRAQVSRAQPSADWRATRARFAQLRSEYAQFECDPLAVLRLPALTDVTVPSTGRFVDAFAEAQALDTDTEPPGAHSARFATAVDQAWRTWQAAREAAERIRLARIPAQEQATVARAIKLLTMARNSDHDAERIAAYAKARAELAKLDRSGILRLPQAATAALDAAARPQLPAS